MEHLMGNGTHLYRRNSHLVRTPIKIALAPSERAYYSVAGSYTSTNYPNSGFLDGMTRNNTIKVGAECVYASLVPPGNNQHWREVTNNHDPETVWYQGGYGTSASSLNLATTSSEAFIQHAAYRFVIPPALSSLVVQSVKVSFVNGGGISCYGPAYLRSAQNRTLKGHGNINDWYLPFYVTEYTPQSSNQIPPLATPQTIVAQKPYDDQIDLLADTGNFTGDRNLWNFNDGNRDGGIPALYTPPTKSYYMGANTLSFVNQHRDFWIVPITSTTYGGAGEGNYFPYYVHPTGGWWGCVSVWGLSTEVLLGG